MAAPRPLPTAIKKARGNPGRRPFDEDEPRYPVGADPLCHLGTAEREIWQELAPLLTHARVLTEADAHALAYLCEDIAMERLITDKLRPQLGEDGQMRSGLVIQTEHGIRVSPLFKIQTELRARISRGISEFGLNPSARVKVKAEERNAAADLEEMLMGAGGPTGIDLPRA